MAEAKGIKWLPLPIDDFKVPTFAMADRLVRAIIADLEAGKNVLVHCAGGRGRTGTINACVLVRLGFDPGAAIDMVRAARPGSVETPEQMSFIYNYAIRIAGETCAS